MYLAVQSCSCISCDGYFPLMAKVYDSSNVLNKAWERFISHIDLKKKKKIRAGFPISFQSLFPLFHIALFLGSFSYFSLILCIFWLFLQFSEMNTNIFYT